MGRVMVAVLAVSVLLVCAACGGGASTTSTGGNTPPAPVPAPSTQLPQHIVVVMMQNASFDHLFGTFPGANGITPSVPGFTQTDASGKSVSPFKLTDLAPPALQEGRTIYLDSMDGGLMDKYAFLNGDLAMGYYDGTIPGISTLWSYAQQFALADNFFGSVTGEAPTNQLYMVAASDNDFPFSVQPVFGPCQKPDKAAQALTFTNVGDELSQAGVAWTVYQESLGNCSLSSPLHNPFQYFTTTQNSSHIANYSQFSTDLAAGNLPAVSFVIPNHDHNMHPGFAPVTDSITWLDSLIKQLQASSAWNTTAVIVTWDTAGGWYDHVFPQQVDTQGLAPRIPLLVISPLAKKNYVSHVEMDHVSILRYIQKVWNLPSLNTRNTMSVDLSDMFQ
jgi:phospholipase C